MIIVQKDRVRTRHAEFHPRPEIPGYDRPIVPAGTRGVCLGRGQADDRLIVELQGYGIRYYHDGELVLDDVKQGACEEHG